MGDITDSAARGQCSAFVSLRLISGGLRGFIVEFTQLQAVSGSLNGVVQNDQSGAIHHMVIVVVNWLMIFVCAVHFNGDV